MICEVCGVKPAQHKHHKFSQTKAAKKAYGKLIHHRKNIMYLCEECHLWKGAPKWSEVEFCQALGVKPRLQSGKDLWERKNK